MNVVFLLLYALKSVHSFSGSPPSTPSAKRKAPASETGVSSGSVHRLSASPLSTPSAKRKAPASETGVNTGLVTAADVPHTKKKRTFLSSKHVDNDVVNNDISVVNAGNSALSKVYVHLSPMLIKRLALAAEENKTQTLECSSVKSPAKPRAKTYSDVLTSDKSFLNPKRYTTPVLLSDDDSMPEVSSIFKSRYQLKKVAVSLVHAVDVIDNDGNDFSHVSDSPGSLVDFVVADGSENVSGDKLMEDRSDCTVVSNAATLVSLDDSTDPAKIVDYSAFVMQPSIQDSLLVPTYKNLPYIA
ncbi:hypothetical protein C0992_010359 [Termitomyces sp. T32_za158]|nr:hypothetical protein C0992_010359 [Termitomyces sp. T32_za158]